MAVRKCREGVSRRQPTSGLLLRSASADAEASAISACFLKTSSRRNLPFSSTGARRWTILGRNEPQGALERLLDAHGEQSNRTSAVPIGASKPPNRPVFFLVEKWAKNGTEHCRAGRSLGGRRLRERRVRVTARQFTGARLPGVTSADAAAGLQRAFWP